MITTAQILAERALQKSCSEQCVNWAIGLLESGCESPTACRLAAKCPPHNHFELASLRDQVLEELGVIDTPHDEAIIDFAAELLSRAEDETMDLDAAIEMVKDLCVANNYQADLHDFYLLYFARTDLREREYQYYWSDADRSNIDEVTRERVRRFLTEYRNRRTPT